ncbi:MAG: hypothetical protein JWN43_3936 [Gammaproteobacteria bacterium]|nr:hypothetical protein [Gammaproteobacteria bacterium]
MSQITLNAPDVATALDHVAASDALIEGNRPA